jgi:aryl-alcohol dehydrogenase-like predicted oxidoreductase
MKNAGSSRREFLRASAALAAAWSFAPRRSLFQAAAPAQKSGGPAAKPSPLEKRRFGRTDMDVTVLGFGGAEIGFERTDQETVSKLLNAALDAGLNVVDTAECYVDSEVQIAKAIGARRKEFFLFTKCGHSPESPGWTKDAILKSVERSLKRLNTEVVDLLQLHTCAIDELKKGECIEALELAKKQGKTRYIGYSGDSQAARYAVECGRFDALQTSVSFLDQECVELTLPLAKEKNMGVVAKRPIANAVWRHDKKPDNGSHVAYWQRLQELKYDFASGDARQREDADGPAGIALRFTAMQPGVDVLIVGTSKPERWKQNAELMKAGALNQELEASIRAHWKAVAKSDWIGQT